MLIDADAVSTQQESTDAHAWLGQVLANFAVAEQAIGRLSVALGLPITNGSLASLADIRRRLVESSERKCSALDKRIGRWVSNRPFRHLLAHATVVSLTDSCGREVIITRHLPRDQSDVTPDRMWTVEERKEMLRQASNDGRSIRDHVEGLLSNPALLRKLRAA